MEKPEQTMRELLYWAYANLAAYRMALSQDPPAYTKDAWAARSRLYKGLTEGTVSMASMYKTERAKLSSCGRCSYCGAEGIPLTLDHLFPKVYGGPDGADNLVYACGPCNSSKGAKDYFAWCAETGRKPDADVAERYLKNAVALCEERGLMDAAPAECRTAGLPFDIDAIPAGRMRI